jgi:hypothetical protein
VPEILRKSAELIWRRERGPWRQCSISAGITTDQQIESFTRRLAVDRQGGEQHQQCLINCEHNARLETIASAQLCLEPDGLSSSVHPTSEIIDEDARRFVDALARSCPCGCVSHGSRPQWSRDTNRRHRRVTKNRPLYDPGTGADACRAATHPVACAEVAATVRATAPAVTSARDHPRCSHHSTPTPAPPGKTNG